VTTDAGAPAPGSQVDGLTDDEAVARRRRGEGNVAVTGSSRTYATILRTNVFSFYNTILFVIGAALLALGRYNDAIVSVGLGLVNAAISAVQEIRAKRQLDRLQLLSRSVVHVVRGGREVAVAPEDVVRGDVVHVRAGDQIAVDGPVLDGGRIEVDESLLSGESDPLVKGRATTSCRAASAPAGTATSSPATSVRPAMRTGSPPRPGATRPT
jgi:cation-transporting ATPase E